MIILHYFVGIRHTIGSNNTIGNSTIYEDTAETSREDALAMDYLLKRFCLICIPQRSSQTVGDVTSDGHGCGQVSKNLPFLFTGTFWTHYLLGIFTGDGDNISRL